MQSKSVQWGLGLQDKTGTLLTELRADGMIQGGIDLEFLKLFLPKVRIGPRGGVG